MSLVAVPNLPRLVQYENDLEDLIERHEGEYDKLVQEISLRATDGVTVCEEETHKDPSHQNRSASFNTRRPGVEVMRMRENATRLRELGRIDEANEFAVRAAKLDEEDECKFRQKCIEAGGRALLQRQLATQARRALSASSSRRALAVVAFAREARRVRAHVVASAASPTYVSTNRGVGVGVQDQELAAVKQTHESRVQTLRHQQNHQEQNLLRLQAAEHKKVIEQCKAQTEKMFHSSIGEVAQPQAKARLSESSSASKRLGDDNSDGESASPSTGRVSRRGEHLCEATPTRGAGADEDRGDVPTCCPRTIHTHVYSPQEQESSEAECERASSSVAIVLQRWPQQHEGGRVHDRRERAAKTIQCSQRRRVSVTEAHGRRAKAERERETKREREMVREMMEREVKREMERERELKLERERETERERAMEREREAAAATKMQSVWRRRASANRVEGLRAERERGRRAARPRHRGHHPRRLTNAARDSDADDAKVGREEILHSFLRLRWIATPRRTLRALLARGEVFELFSRFCSKLDADAIATAGGGSDGRMIGTTRVSNGLPQRRDDGATVVALAPASSIEGGGGEAGEAAGLLAAAGGVQKLLDRSSRCSRTQTTSEDASEQLVGARCFELLALAYLPKFLADRSAYAELRRLVDVDDTLLSTSSPSSLNLAEVWLGAFANVIERLPQGVVVVDVTGLTLVVVLANSLCCRSCFGGAVAHPRAAMGEPLFSLYPRHVRPNPKAMRVAFESLMRGRSCSVRISANQMLSLRPVTDRSARTRLCVGMHLDLRANNTGSLQSRLLHQGAMLAELPCSF